MKYLLHSINNIWTIVIFLAFLIVGLLLVFPLYNIFVASFLDNETGFFTLHNYTDILGRRYYRTAIFNSVIVGLSSMVGALLLGVPLAFFSARYNIKGKSIISTLAILALVSPPFIGAYAWITMLGSNGWLRQALESIGISMPPIYGPLGIILVFSLKFYPFVYLLTAGSISTINVSLEEAAESLGCRPATKFMRVTLPLIFPGVSTGALLAFVLSLADFGTPSIIGRDFRVLSTLAYNLFTSEMGGNPGLASTVSILLILVSLIFVYIHRRLIRKRDYGSDMLRRPKVIPLTRMTAIPIYGICYLIVFLSSLPSLVVIYNSFRKTSGPVFKSGFGLDSYRRVINDVPEAILNSFMFSIIAVVGIVLLGTLIGYAVARKPSIMTGFLDSLLMIPYIVPGIVLGLGFIVSFNNKPIALVGTATIIILIVFIRRLPYSVRSSSSILKQINIGIEEAATSLGAGPSKTFFKITLPLMIPGVLAGAMMAFITAINELSSSIILYVGGTVTMPVRIYLSVLDGEFGTAAALSSILLVATGMAVYAILIVTESDEGFFL
ncbi:MAG: iron ABC transporter permease [Candidatus Marinimicrobia bacterium]|nr:iron ABC transporter permease [Candidatus Neomarinimicrobiota bacterium]